MGIWVTLLKIYSKEAKKDLKEFSVFIALLLIFGFHSHIHNCLLIVPIWGKEEGEVSVLGH